MSDQYIGVDAAEQAEQMSKEINLVLNQVLCRIAKNRTVPLDPKVRQDLIQKLKSVPQRTYLWLNLVL